MMITTMSCLNHSWEKIAMPNSDSDESEDDASSPNTLKPQLDKGKGKMEETLENTPTSSKSKPDKPTASLTKSNKSNYTPTSPLRKPQWKWVPKQAKQDT